MHRNLFAVFASLLMSAGAASASTTTPDQKGLSLEQRVLAAQETINKVIDEQAAKPEQHAYYGGYYRPWYNWRNWNNWRNYGYRY
jgi:hypothetical protein